MGTNAFYMARPKKNTIDYFPHPVKDGSRMYIMEQKYGDKGYCCYYKLLQQLGCSENHYLDFNAVKNRSYFSALIRASEQEMCQMLDTLSEIGTIDPELWTKKIVWCQDLVDSVTDLYTKRKRELPKKPVLDTQNTTTPVVSASQNPQSIVKDSIVKDSKLNETILLEEKFFLKINGTIFKSRVSEYFKQNHGIFFDTWKMQNEKNYVPAADFEKFIAKIFEKLDFDYNGHDFTNDNHVKNAFKKIYENLISGKNGKQNTTNSTSIINPGKEWDD